ncbi:MAG: AEC family transporter [Verrucomicrobia bacterium]|nr:AEC family transporter [Verrucomicrobiota bacterium]MBU4430120.1 AEC family transporter [Verrucomicrobiota bacterium]MCG2680351.1 AEC family transporter [Kiritimatiellia bacterium]
MSDFLSVLLKIVSMFLVMALGWIARRRGYVTDETSRSLSRLLVDMIFPALVFTQMLRTVNPAVLREGWFLPLLGYLLIVIALVVGLLMIPLCREKAKIGTVLFLVAIPNWLYLPLPIVEGMFGDAGVRDVLLYNVGAQLALWTLGIWALQNARFDRQSLKNLLVNPGLIATAAGIVLALVCPPARCLEAVPPGHGTPLVWTAAAVIQALVMLGSLTIPLSLLVTGIQLGSLNLLIDHRPSREFTGILIGRLLIAPAVTIAIVWLCSQAGLTLAEVPRMTGYIIAGMPVAISCSILTERFGGDTLLSARAIFYSTLWSIITVPAWYYLIRLWGL